MIEREVKKYVRKKNQDGTNSYLYRINVSKQDNLDDKVFILNQIEYIELNNKVETLTKEVESKETKHNRQLANKDNEIGKLKTKVQDLQESKATLEDMKKILDERDIKQKETIKELDQQHTDQLKESYIKFNEDINKYIVLNQLQNQTLKNISKLGFMDILTNKHKNMAKETIKKAIDEKPVYELRKKEE